MAGTRTGWIKYHSIRLHHPGGRQWVYHGRRIAGVLHIEFYPSKHSSSHPKHLMNNYPTWILVWQVGSPPTTLRLSMKNHYHNILIDNNRFDYLSVEYEVMVTGHTGFIHNCLSIVCTNRGIVITTIVRGCRIFLLRHDSITEIYGSIMSVLQQIWCSRMGFTLLQKYIQNLKIKLG